jgi:hypothetical protein
MSLHAKKPQSARAAWKTTKRIHVALTGPFLEKNVLFETRPESILRWHRAASRQRKGRYG